MHQVIKDPSTWVIHLTLTSRMHEIGLELYLIGAKEGCRRALRVNRHLPAPRHLLMRVQYYWSTNYLI